MRLNKKDILIKTAVFGLLAISLLAACGKNQSPGLQAIGSGNNSSQTTTNLVLESSDLPGIIPPQEIDLALPYQARFTWHEKTIDVSSQYPLLILDVGKTYLTVTPEGDTSIEAEDFVMAATYLMGTKDEEGNQTSPSRLPYAVNINVNNIVGYYTFRNGKVIFHEFNPDDATSPQGDTYFTPKQGYTFGSCSGGFDDLLRPLGTGAESCPLEVAIFAYNGKAIGSFGNAEP